LVIDPYRKLSGPIALQSFKPIAWQRGQISQAYRSDQSIETRLGLSGKSGKFLDMLASGKSLSAFVAVADDHGAKTNSVYGLRKQ